MLSQINIGFSPSQCGQTKLSRHSLLDSCSKVRESECFTGQPQDKSDCSSGVLFLMERLVYTPAIIRRF